MNDETNERYARKFALWIAVILGLTLCSGCSTIASHGLAKGAPPPYAGTYINSHLIKDAGSEAASDGTGPAIIVVVYGVIDFPFSLVADTLCLPYDLAVAE